MRRTLCTVSRRVLTAIRAAKRPPRVDGRERRSEAAPTTARAASARGNAMLQQRIANYGPALQSGLTPYAAGIFVSRHYDFRSVWSLGTVGGRDEF